ncbi:MAG: hypothetical protein HGA67_01795 [Candidatus Yonathbacteria bacterium]|nr:hypothetical protein [Candidatus Yonathbacteria bacterium]
MTNKRQLFLILGIVAIVILAYSVVRYWGPFDSVGTEDIALPQGYTLEHYTIAETTNVACEKSTECVTPPGYLMRSNCPYTSLCLEWKCVVVCPSYSER